MRVLLAMGMGGAVVTRKLSPKGFSFVWRPIALQKHEGVYSEDEDGVSLVSDGPG